MNKPEIIDLDFTHFYDNENDCTRPCKIIDYTAYTDLKAECEALNEAMRADVDSYVKDFRHLICPESIKALARYAAYKKGLEK